MPDCCFVLQSLYVGSSGEVVQIGFLSSSFFFLVKGEKEKKLKKKKELIGA